MEVVIPSSAIGGVVLIVAIVIGVALRRRCSSQPGNRPQESQGSLEEMSEEELQQIIELAPVECPSSPEEYTQDDVRPNPEVNEEHGSRPIPGFVLSRPGHGCIPPVDVSAEDVAYLTTSNTPPTSSTATDSRWRKRDKIVSIYPD